MSDRSFGAYSHILRTPDLWLTDVRTTVLAELPPFDRRICDPNRSFFFYARRGAFLLDIDGSSRPTIRLPQGTAVGFEAGRAHRWRAPSAREAGLAVDQPVELFLGTTPRRFSVLQQVDDGIVIVPPDAEPFATVIRHCVELQICDLQDPTPDKDGGITRRAAEMSLMQLVRYVRSTVSAEPYVPSGLAHDDYLLRVWSAYFANPRRRWTVQALADVAGLGRTAFVERFRNAFGSPPLQTLTELRLDQAANMLSHSKASITEIAFTVGYNSEAAFVRAFHRRHGLPPGRFRAEHKGV